VLEALDFALFGTDERQPAPVRVVGNRVHALL
jgi:hypothetical protein